jgi:seryl-tRNA synthetase
LALPGEYQVKLTVGGKSQTAPLHLVIDPRNKGQEAALQKQFALAMQVNERMSQLHQAVNEIRDLRTQIQNLHKRFGDDQRLKPALAAADGLDQKMSEVEQKLIQVNMKGSEANLAFPNMLNERFDTFSHVVESGDKEPTKPQLEVFEILDSQLQEQLKKWAQLKQEDVAKVSELVKEANLPALIVAEPKKT